MATTRGRRPVASKSTSTERRHATAQRGRRQDEEPATRIGNDDGVVDHDGVAVSFGDGGAYFVPRGLRNVTPAQRDVMQRIQDRVRANIAVLAQLDQLVDQARELGMSWSSIGWCAGLSEAGARKRWGGDS